MNVTKRLALLPLRDGVTLTIRKLHDEGTGAASFCLVDASNTPFVDPYTNRNTWSCVALSSMLRTNKWKPDITRVKFTAEGYVIYEDAQQSVS